MSRIQRGLLLFTIPQAIPSSATVTNADLALHLNTTANTSAKEVDVYQLTHGWTSAATWNTYDGTNAWTTPGGDFSSTIAASNTGVGPTVNTWYHWYPTGLVQSWVNGTATNDGVLLKEPVENAQDSLYFDSSTAATPGNRPSLTITWSPDLGSLPWFTVDGGVNVVNGNLVLGSTDVSMGGIGIPLTVSRTYNGLSTSTSDFGNRWVMDAGADVGLQVAADGSVLLNGSTGYQAVFIKNSDGTYTHPPGIDADLVKNQDGSYTLTAHANGEKLAFSSGGVLTSGVTTTGNTLTYTYTGSLLSSITDTLGQTTTFTYASPASPNLISTITDAAGRTYQYAYDANKNLTSYTTPNNETTHYGYDASGNLTSITDPMNNTTTIGYDASGRVTAITDALNHTTGYTYNAGNTVVTDPNNHQTTYAYDGQGRVTAVTDALNHTGHTSWNSDNHVTQDIAPSGATTTYTYASNNENLTKVQLADGVTTSAAYSNSTWLYYPTVVTDAQGNTSTITYNTATGTVSSVTDASNHSVSYTYYGDGTLRSATDENGHATTYTYANNNTGLPAQDTPPAPLGTTQYAFNPYNLESSVTDGNGKLTTFSYDLDGQLTAWTFADSSVGYAYDANGNVTAMTDGTGQTGYTYNAINELTSKTLPDTSTQTVLCPVGPGGTNVHVSVCYSYDAAGNLTAKTDKWGTVSYVYNQIDEVTNVTDRQGNPYTVGYDQDGSQTSIGFPNGVTEAMTYDAAGALTKVKGSKGASTLTSYSYSYTNPSTGSVTGLPYSVTNASNATTSYSYENTNELTQAQQKDSGGTVLSTWTFGYDPAGNLTSKQLNSNPQTTFSYNAADELTSASGGMTASYAYDGNGDRTSATVAGQTQQINLNAGGQITSITPAGGSAIPYTYTGTGEQERVSAGSSSYQYDATGLSRQTDSDGDTTFTALPDGTLLSENIPGGTYAGSYYYLSDGAGSVAAVTNSAGSVKDSYSYDPLGNAASTGSVPNPFTFQGGMYDSQTGYYYTGSGYYDPANGQTFGCHDRGPYDPGEDLCGEDENPACGGVCSGGQSSGSIIGSDPMIVSTGCTLSVTWTNQAQFRATAHSRINVHAHVHCLTPMWKAVINITVYYQPGGRGTHATPVLLGWEPCNLEEPIRAARPGFFDYYCPDPLGLQINTDRKGRYIALACAEVWLAEPSAEGAWGGFGRTTGIAEKSRNSTG